MSEQGSIQTKVICGIVMPISSIDGLSEQHWAEVRNIVEDSIADADMEPRLVSDADDSGVIQKRIIQNLFNDPIIVCDVSAKNSNVMFELGIRLAFDKPVVIIKDDLTKYSFDTAVIEHITYPRDLRFTNIVEFKEQLTKKVQATLSRAISDPNYTTFLKHFGTFKVAELESGEISSDELILNEIQELRDTVRRFTRETARPKHLRNYDAIRGMELISRAIREYTKINKIRSKGSAKKAVEDILSAVEAAFPAYRFFPERDEFLRAFHSVFFSIYG